MRPDLKLLLCPLQPDAFTSGRAPSVCQALCSVLGLQRWGRHAPVFERCVVTGLCCCLWFLGRNVEGLFQFCQVMSAFRTEPSLAAAGPGYIPSKQHPCSLCCLFPLRLCPLREVTKVALLPLLVLAEHAAQEPVGFKVRIRSKMKEGTTVSSPAYLSSVQPHSPALSSHHTVRNQPWGGTGEEIAMTGDIFGGLSHMAGALQQSFVSGRNPRLTTNVLLRDAGFFNKQRK